MPITRFITNSAFMFIFLPIVAKDGPVPGVDPQWFGKALTGGLFLTAIQLMVDGATAKQSPTAKL